MSLKEREQRVTKNPIANLHVHQHSMEYINYSISKHSNTGVLVILIPKFYRQALCILKVRITFIFFKKYQLNPWVYTDGDRINAFYVMPPVSGNKQNLKSKQKGLA